MAEVPIDEAVTDSVAASEEKPRGSGVIPEPSLGMIYFAFSLFCFSLPPFADIYFFSLPIDLP